MRFVSMYHGIYRLWILLMTIHLLLHWSTPYSRIVDKMPSFRPSNNIGLYFRIDSNVEETELNVEAAHSELLKYFQSISSNRWLIIKIFFVLIIFFIIFVVFMVWNKSEISFQSLKHRQQVTWFFDLKNKRQSGKPWIYGHQKNSEYNLNMILSEENEKKRSMC